MGRLLDLARQAADERTTAPEAKIEAQRTAQQYKAAMAGVAARTGVLKKYDGPAAEARRQRVLAKLTANPALRLAVVCDGEGDPVPVAVAIRDKGTCEILIPAARFDPFALIELVGRQGRTLH